MISILKLKYYNLTLQAKAAIWFLICSFMQKGISSITTPIFTRLLSTEEYGQFNVFNSWLNIISICITFNMFNGVYGQGLIKFSKNRDVFSSSLQGLTTTLISFGTVIYFLFRNFWNQLFSLTTVQMMAMLVMIWTSATFNFWASEQRVLYCYKKLVIVTLFVSIAKPIVGVIFVVLSEDKVTARILGLMLVELIGYTGLYLSQMLKGKKFFSKFFWKYALLYNIPLIPHYLSQIVLSSADRIMIKIMVGDSESGIYSLAYSVSLIMTLFNTALMQTLSPWIYQKIKEKKISEIASIAYISMAIVAVANLLLILLAPEVIAIFAPKSYYAAIAIIPPVAMSVYFMYCYDLFAKFAFYYEKTFFIMIASVIGAVFNIVLNYFFIRKCGYITAGYTTLACYVLYCVFHYLFMNKVCAKYTNMKSPYNLKILIGITLAFVFFGFTFLFTYSYPMIRYLLVGVITITAFIFRNRIINIFRKIMSVKNVDL